jgi:hypothetical protein
MKFPSPQTKTSSNSKELWGGPATGRVESEFFYTENA